MKFNKYIAESRNDTTIEDILTKLYKDCMPYIKDVLRKKNDIGFLLSGRYNDRDFFKKDVRMERDPKDMSTEWHEALDDAFKHKFGWKARSDSMFVTGSQSQAGGYGSAVYMIFPIGKYKFVWNRNITDLYTHLQDTGAGGEGFEDYVEGLISDNFDNWKGQAEDNYENEYGEGQNGYWNISIEKIKKNFDDMSLDDAIKEFLEYIEDEDLSDEDKEYIQKELGENSDEYTTWNPAYDYENYIDDQRDEMRQTLLRDGDIRNEYMNDTIDDLASDIVREYSDKDIIKTIEGRVEIMLNCKSYYAVKFSGYYTMISDYMKLNGTNPPMRQRIIDWYMKNNGRLPKQLSLFGDISNDDIKKGVR